MNIDKINKIEGEIREIIFLRVDKSELKDYIIRLAREENVTINENEIENRAREIVWQRANKFEEAKKLIEEVFGIKFLEPSF
ncbi:MAG: hypothetical protein QXR58_02330 [Candidatus Micrarchaeaceae archaeon]